MNKDGIIDHTDMQSWVPSFDKQELKVSYGSKIEPIVQKIYHAEDIYEDAYDLVYPVHAPVADAGPDQTILEQDATVILDGSNSYDSDGQIVDYTWRSGDTVYCQGSDPVCSVVNPNMGENRFKLTVTDNDGLQDNAIMFANYPYTPVAEAGRDVNTTNTRSLILDASGSYDEDGYIVEFIWEKNGEIICQSESPTCTVETLEWGLNEFELTVKDDVGAFGYDSVVVNALPDEIMLLGSFNTSGFAGDIKVNAAGTLAYVADWYGGLKIFDISNPAAISKIGELKDYRSFRTISLSEDEKFVYMTEVTDAEFLVIDVSDPANPIQLAKKGVTSYYPLHATLASDDMSAYVVDGYGMHIVDIADPSTPNVIGRFITDGWANDVVLSIDTNIAYVADKGSIRIVDISDKTSPMLMSSIITDTANERLQLASDGSMLYVSDILGGMKILDVNDPYAPFVIGSIDGFQQGGSFNISNSGEIAFMDANIYGIYVIDISDPSNPTYIDNYKIPKQAYSSTLSEDGTKLYIADGEYGIKIFDVRAVLK